MCEFTKSVCVREGVVSVANVLMLHAATCAELHNACSVAEHVYACMYDIIHLSSCHDS